MRANDSTLGTGNSSLFPSSAHSIGASELVFYEDRLGITDRASLQARDQKPRITGDIHQPLHTMARFDRSRPDGDRGGNSQVTKGGNLHSYWDSRIGTSQTDRFLDQLTATILLRYPKPNQLSMNPEQWAKEGFDLRSQVYGFIGDGTERRPAIMSDAYSVNARETAYARAALAGYRLAEFLNQRLK